MELRVKNRTFCLILLVFLTFDIKNGKKIRGHSQGTSAADPPGEGRKNWTKPDAGEGAVFEILSWGISVPGEPNRPALPD